VCDESRTHGSNGGIGETCLRVTRPDPTHLVLIHPDLALAPFEACFNIDLLSAPLTILLVCCPIKSFRQASRCGEARARRRKEERRASHHEACETRGSLLLPCVRPRGVPARGVVPERCHASGAAVDARRDTTAGVRQAAHAADGDVVDPPRTLSGSPRAPCMHAQRGARCDPYNTRNCLPPKK